MNKTMVVFIMQHCSLYFSDTFSLTFSTPFSLLWNLLSSNLLKFYVSLLILCTSGHFAVMDNGEEHWLTLLWYINGQHLTDLLFSMTLQLLYCSQSLPLGGVGGDENASLCRRRRTRKDTNKQVSHKRWLECIFQMFKRTQRSVSAPLS